MQPLTIARCEHRFIMVDPDGNTQPPYHWPFALPGDLAIARHWVVGNIPGDRLAAGFRGNVEATLDSIATVVAPYVSPRPFHGSHRYGQFVFEQPGPIAFAKMRNRDAFGERFHWNVTGVLAHTNRGMSPQSVVPAAAAPPCAQWRRIVA